MSFESTLTEAIPTPVRRKPPEIEEPRTQRVYPVEAPTLTLHRDGIGWRSADDTFRYPTTLHMFADWPSGVDEIPDPTPLETATAYFSGRPIPYDVTEVTQAEWDAARVIVEEVMKDVLSPASS